MNTRLYVCTLMCIMSCVIMSMQEEKSDKAIHLHEESSELQLSDLSFPELVQLALEDDSSQELQNAIATSLAQGATINMPIENGDTALLLAAQGNVLHLMKLLLAQPTIDLTVRSTNLETVIMYAIQADSLRILEMLVEHPKITQIINAQDESESTALMYAIDREFNAEEKYLKDIHTTIIQRLLSVKNIDPNIKDSTGDAAIHYAAAHNQAGIITLLLQNEKTDPFIINHDNATALEIAAHHGSIQAVRVLLPIAYTSETIARAIGYIVENKALEENDQERKAFDEILDALKHALKESKKREKGHSQIPQFKRRKITGGVYHVRR